MGGVSRAGNHIAEASQSIKRDVSGKSKHGHGMPLGFVSRAQLRYFFANPELRIKYAHKEAHKAGLYSAITKVVGHSPRWQTLPEHVRDGVPIAVGGPSNIGQGRVDVKRGAKKLGHALKKV